MRERLPIPDKIRNAPDLPLGLELFYGAFLDLTNSRSGLGDGPISWMAVHEYGLISGLDEEQLEDLHFHVSRMDNAYLKWSRDDAKPK